MCRINGIISKKVNVEQVNLMRDSLIYGGPDDGGVYINEDKTVGLGHRRLSIVDLSSAGHQPMCWKNYVIVFNGEIYNYQEIAKELKSLGYTFETSSDTEVIIKAFDYWGNKFVDKFRGMFAFAIWDVLKERLLLCRDRVGVKPLYWYLNDGLFMFASELKAFHTNLNFDKTINNLALSSFLQSGYIRSPFCIFKYAHKLEPGTFLEIDKSLKVKTWKYWSAETFISQTHNKYEPDTYYIEKCEKILTESFMLRMVSDVPVGVFLSGGVDSSIVTAILQRQFTTPLNTFTIGFEEKRLNEAPFAREIANFLNTNHTELICTEKDFKSIIEELPFFYDEPFGDSSAIPTYLVSKLAKQKVTVSLSADGGDELFGGYERYNLAEKLYSKFQYSKSVKTSLYTLVNRLDSSKIQHWGNIFFNNSKIVENIDSRIPKLLAAIKAENHIDYLGAATEFISQKTLKEIYKYYVDTSIFNQNLASFSDNKFSLYGLYDINSYLEGDILTKVDRATMQVALEGREPFLDHNIIEFALSLPDSLKVRDGKSKWILRQILYKYVPSELIERPKMGFSIPMRRWLSTVLSEELKLLQNDTDFFECFDFNQNIINNMINNFIRSKNSSPVFIWNFLMLHQWYLRWLK